VVSRSLEAFRVLLGDFASSFPTTKTRVSQYYFCEEFREVKGLLSSELPVVGSTLMHTLPDPDINTGCKSAYHRRLLLSRSFSSPKVSIDMPNLTVESYHSASPDLLLGPPVTSGFDNSPPAAQSDGKVFDSVAEGSVDAAEKVTPVSEITISQPPRL
jgi:hypothetical protein